jgi:hypothetical protein
MEHDFLNPFLLTGVTLYKCLLDPPKVDSKIKDARLAIDYKLRTALWP